MDIQHEQISHDYSILKLTAFRHSVLHWHQRLEMLYLQEGELSVQIGERRYQGKPGDVFVIQSGEVHHLVADSEAFTLYVCTFNPAILYALRPDICHVTNHLTDAMLTQAGLAPEVRRLFMEIYAEKAAQKKWSDVIVQTDILRLYGLFARHFEAPVLRTKKDIEKFKSFQTALTYMSEHYPEDISLTGIAKKLNYTPAYVSRMFVTYTGVNFKVYLDTLRISKAIKLIQNTDLTFSKISILCGFENIRTFNNVFARITGCTPGEYKRTRT